MFSTRTPPLAAQYHYHDSAGNEIILLAGRDYSADEDGTERFPPHDSRWWAYVGAEPVLLYRVMHELTRIWSLDWQDDQELHDDEDEAA